MYEIYCKSTSGDELTIDIINREYAFTTFMRIINAVDIVVAHMLDGLTGEIIHSFSNGKVQF